jgi:hypothetical protein
MQIAGAVQSASVLQIGLQVPSLAHIRDLAALSAGGQQSRSVLHVPVSFAQTAHTLFVLHHAPAFGSLPWQQSLSRPHSPSFATHATHLPSVQERPEQQGAPPSRQSPSLETQPPSGILPSVGVLPSVVLGELLQANANAPAIITTNIHSLIDFMHTSI